MKSGRAEPNDLSKVEKIPSWVMPMGRRWQKKRNLKFPGGKVRV